MRLVCPNCEAKYEVPDDAIPETGRDVQCTNCGHSWYQMRGRNGGAAMVVASSSDASTPAADAVSADAPVAETVPDAEVPAGETTLPAADAALAAAEVGESAVAATDPGDVTPAAEAPADMVEDAAAFEAEVAAPAEAEHLKVEEAAEPAADIEDTARADVAPAAAADMEAKPEEVAAALDATASNTAEAAVADVVAAEASPEAVADAVDREMGDATPAPAPSYAVDDSVLAILREEAEREANARRAEALESQTELGIDSAMPRKAGSPLAEADAKPAARRDLLPDVEEINSTLRPSEMAESVDAPDFVAPPPEAPSGFRSGFLSLMTVAILGAALYLVAPRLAVMVPSLAGPLESYISMIDSLRLGLDGMMRSATVAISDG